MKAEKVTRDEKAKDEAVVHQRAIAPSQDEENLPEKKEFISFLGRKDVQGSRDPGPIKCLCAPSHQILAKSAPQKARNRDNVEFATKVRKSSINC